MDGKGQEAERFLRSGMEKRFDKIIIGAGLYGVYAARFCAEKGEKVLLLEYDRELFSRATYVNQARVHMGYHYPRSLTTALKSAGYFRRFVNDFGFCIHDKFEQVYATSDKFSWTSAEQFSEFCRAASIRCDEVAVSRYFKEGMCDGAFLTEEYTYDAKILGTYASVNQILQKIEGEDSEKFQIKYELCEIILCEPSKMLQRLGLTVMDGPFFSIMPFGRTGLHSLTSVTFTPHVTSYDVLPVFQCQKKLDKGKFICTSRELGNCKDCPHQPQTAWNYMSHLADKYIKEEFGYTYKESLYSMKPILKSSEIDDSRPTAIKVHSENPTFVSVLSGKINTVYDLDEYLQG